MAVILETSIGDITVDLFVKERPRCCLNFLKLCKIKYYNFTLFHSVQKNLAAQTGDPTETGRGGHSIYKILHGEQASYFDAELKPRIKHKTFGTVSMVNNGSNMHGSQFFITLGEDIDYLDRQMHTVFGQVGDGFDTVKKFNETFTDPKNRPFKDIRIFHTVILEDPFDDPDGLSAHIPDSSPEPTKEQLESIRIGVDEDIDEDDGLSKEVLEERTKEKEAQASAQILEMIGDLPAVDVKPPDNVLFVCKLNPVTTSEDLEIIFSRFGTIECCEVIKDRKTSESLQYAFIEFKEPKDCESAYFKMDNVLIDDRRIHVDFSQSVSKFKWNRKGKEANVKSNEKEDERPQFRIKDPDLRIDNKYDFVFDNDNDDADEKSNTKDKKHTAHKKSKKEKKHKKHRHSSTDSESSRHKKSKRELAEQSHARYRSRSPGPKSHSDNSKHHHRSHSDRDNNRSERHNSSDRKRERDTERHNSSDRKRERDTERHNSSDRKRERDTERHNSSDKKERHSGSSKKKERDSERHNSSDRKKRHSSSSKKRDHDAEGRNGSEKRREREERR